MLYAPKSLATITTGSLRMTLPRRLFALHSPDDTATVAQLSSGLGRPLPTGPGGTWAAAPGAEGPASRSPSAAWSSTGTRAVRPSPRVRDAVPAPVEFEVARRLRGRGRGRGDGGMAGQG